MELVSPISRRLLLKTKLPSSEACSIIVPVYNNQGTLSELCKRIHSALDSRGLTYKLHLVIDGSPDKSAETADAIASKNPNINVIKLKKKHGQAKASLEGLKRAGGRISVIMDADLQDEPEIIPILVEKLSKENPIVFAAKTCRYQSWHRLCTTSIFRLARSTVIDLPKNAGGFVAFSNTVKKKLLMMEPWPQISAMLGILPFSKSAVSVTRLERKDGKSSWTSTARLQTGLKTIFLAATYRLKETFGPGYKWLMAVFPLFFLISLTMSVMHGVNKGDEAWILQIIDRMKHGEALYSNIYYATTPLAIWLGNMFCSLFGLHVLSIKIYAALLQALLCVLSGLFILKAEGKITTALLTSAAVYVFGYENLGSGPIYNALSFVFLLSLAVHAYPHRRTWDIAPANLRWNNMVTVGLIALCILSKHTVGFFALSAYSTLFIFRYFTEPTDRKPKLDQLLTVLMVTGATLALALGLGFHVTSWEKFYEYCFTNKTGYIKLGSISYIG